MSLYPESEGGTLHCILPRGRGKERVRASARDTGGACSRECVCVSERVCVREREREREREKERERERERKREKERERERKARRPPRSLSMSGVTTLCRMTGVTSHGHVRYKEIQARTCCGLLSSPVKPYSHTMSMCALSARAEPSRQTVDQARGARAGRTVPETFSVSGLGFCGQGSRVKGAGFQV